MELVNNAFSVGESTDIDIFDISSDSDNKSPDIDTQTIPSPDTISTEEEAVKSTSEEEQIDYTSDIFGIDEEEQQDLDEDIEDAEVVDEVNKEGDLDPNEEEANLDFFIAQQIKKDGWLPEDYEVSEDTKLTDAYSVMVENMRASAETQVTQQVLTKLAQEGYNKEDLEYAKLIRGGVDPNLLSDVYRYEKYSKVNTEEAQESELKEVVKEYYKDRSWKDTEIQERLEQLEIEGKLESAGQEASEYFGNKHKETLTQEAHRVEQQKEHAAKIAQQQEQYVNNILDKGDLLGDKIRNQKDFREAIYTQKYVMEVQGQKVPVTELQHFLVNFEQDAAVKLWAFNKWKNRDTEKQEIKKEAKAEAEEELLSGYKKVITKTKSPTTTRKIKQQIKERQSKSEKEFRGILGLNGPTIVNG